MSLNNTLSQFRKTRFSYFRAFSFISLVTLILFISTTNVYSAQVTLAWNPNTEGDLAGYKIYYGSSSMNYDKNIDVGNQTSHTLSDLVEGETNYIALTAYDTFNNESDFSAEVVYNVPVLDLTAPSTPTSLQATAASTSQINLSWNASTDDVGVTGYMIYRDGALITTTANTTYEDTGLNPSTTYSYTVSAYDAAGNESGQSSASSAITLSLSTNNPPVLSSIGNKSVNEGQTLSFTISATDDGDTLIYTATNLPSGASFDGNTQTFSWTPANNQAGTYSNITFQVSDGSLTDSQDVTITVVNTNRAPVLGAIADITVNEGDTITLNPTATDPDEDALTFSYSGWMNSPTYSTNFSDAGIHTVTVTVSDGSLTDSQDVTITVVNTNRAPVLGAIADITVNEGATITLNPTATDPDGDTLTYTYSGWMSSASYTTGYNDVGTHIVTVTVSDGSLTDLKDVTIIVNDVDTTPPAISSVNINSPTQVNVVFSEPVEESSSTDVLNYSIDNAITVFTASLGSDLKTVTLTTSELTDGVTYILTVNNIMDLASIPNVIAPNTTASYTFVNQLVISNLTVESGRAYEIVENGLQNGAMVYIDRESMYNSVPTLLKGATYIKTANKDKGESKSSFLTFDVNQDVTVYVAHDNRITTKPSWLTSFTDTGNDLVTTDTALSIFANNFLAGTITLGGNEGKGNRRMYTVIIVKYDDSGGSGCTDADGDGVCVEDGDCDDNDPNTYPGATEFCDGIDNNCDGVIDEGCSGGCTDNDGDGWCIEDGDCDDNDRHVNPGHNDAGGRWGKDGVDNDCNGIIDG